MYESSESAKTLSNWWRATWSFSCASKWERFEVKFPRSRVPNNTPPNASSRLIFAKLLSVWNQFGNKYIQKINANCFD